MRHSHMRAMAGGTAVHGRAAAAAGLPRPGQRHSHGAEQVAGDALADGGDRTVGEHDQVQVIRYDLGV
jgi:hypothetical protein